MIVITIEDCYAHEELVSEARKVCLSHLACSLTGGSRGCTVHGHAQRDEGEYSHEDHEG